MRVTIRYLLTTISEFLRATYADDDATLLDLGETYLRRPSSSGVTTYSDPRVVFDIVRDSDIGYMVSGYDIPVVTGVELLKMIHGDHGSLPLIPFTGKESEEVASDAISVSATDYLQKQPSSEQYELPIDRIKNSVSEHRVVRRAERYEAVLKALDYPVYVVGKRGRFECVNDTFVDYGDSEVAAVVGRTHDSSCVEDDGDGLPDDRSPEECFGAGGSEHRDGGLTRRRRFNF